MDKPSTILRRLKKAMLDKTSGQQTLAREAICRSYYNVEQGSLARVLTVLGPSYQVALQFIEEFAKALGEAEGEAMPVWPGPKSGGPKEFAMRHGRAMIPFRNLNDIMPSKLFKDTVRQKKDIEDVEWPERAKQLLSDWRDSPAWLVWIPKHGWSQEYAASKTVLEEINNEEIVSRCIDMNFGNRLSFPYSGQPYNHGGVVNAFYGHQFYYGSAVVLAAMGVEEYMGLVDKLIENYEPVAPSVQFTPNAKFFLLLSAVNRPHLDPDSLKRCVAEAIAEIRIGVLEKSGGHTARTVLVDAGKGKGSGGEWRRQKLKEQPVHVAVFDTQPDLNNRLTELLPNVLFERSTGLDDLIRTAPDLVLLHWDAQRRVDGESPQEILLGLRREKPNLPVFLVSKPSRPHLRKLVQDGFARAVISLRSLAAFRKAVQSVRLNKLLEREEQQQASYPFPRQVFQSLPCGNFRCDLRAPRSKRVKLDRPYVAEATIRESFKNVWGQYFIKERLTRSIGLLLTPQYALSQGIRPPSGCLLIGPSGCGKTFIVRCLAGELNIPVLTTTGGELLLNSDSESGDASILTLFKQARAMAPCVVFIDEVEKLFKPGLNEGDLLLTEMDGFEKSPRYIFVIGATNNEWCLKMINPAFKRAGRFEEVLHMELPSSEDRRSIIQTQYPALFPGIEQTGQTDLALTRIVRRTARWTPAKLQQMFRQSGLEAAERDRAVTVEDLENASLFVKYHAQSTPDFSRPLDKKLTSYHEAGHALVHCERFPNDPIDFLSVEPRHDMLGFMSVALDETHHCPTKEEIRGFIQVALAGREAECLAPHGLTDHEVIHNTGASNDLRVATKWAREAVLDYGMDEKYGYVVYTFGDDADQHLPPFAHARVKAWIDDGATEVRSLLKNKLPALMAVADALIENRTLNHDEIVALIRSAK